MSSVQRPRLFTAFTILDDDDAGVSEVYVRGPEYVGSSTYGTSFREFSYLGH